MGLGVFSRSRDLNDGSKFPEMPAVYAVCPRGSGLRTIVSINQTEDLRAEMAKLAADLAKDSDRMVDSCNYTVYYTVIRDADRREQVLAGMRYLL